MTKKTQKNIKVEIDQHDPTIILVNGEKFRPVKQTFKKIDKISHMDKVRKVYGDVQYCKRRKREEEAEAEFVRMKKDLEARSRYGMALNRISELTSALNKLQQEKNG